VKISDKKFSFFSSRNQYFPHIPYVASKKPPYFLSICSHIQFKNPIQKSTYSISPANHPLVYCTC
jgi:hypothetical protein